MRLIRKKLIAFVFVALILFPLFGVGVGGKAYADTALIGYSGVLDDLQKDDSFNPDEYPANKEDYDKSSYAEIAGFYSLHVIQIAESTAGELFVYVYQPAANEKPLTATQINMSLTDDFAPYDYEDNIDNNQSGGENGSSGGGGGGGGSHGCSLVRTTPSAYLYDLTLLNRNGVFAKYKVTDFVVNGSTVRYYNITSIYRDWVEDIDEPTGNDNTINAVVFPVGKLFTVETIDGQISYKCDKQKVVRVTDKYLARIRVTDGFAFVNASFTDVWYCAFSVDWNIQELYSVDITYSFQHFYKRVVANIVVEDKSDSSPYDITVCLPRDDKAENNPVFLFAENYSKSRIVTASDFIANETLSDTAKEQIKGKQWVIRFAESEYFSSLSSSGVVEYSEVSAVSLLRFNFKSNGVVYNLGVVDNQQTGSTVSNGVKSLWDMFIDFCKWLESVTGVSYVMWVIIILAVPVCLLFGVLSIFFPVIRSVIGTVFKGLLWIICAPFRFIAWIIRKIRGGEE